MSSCVHEFDAVLEKGVNHPKKENDVFDPFILDPNNAIDKAKFDIKHKNDIAIAYITMAFKTNTAMNLNKG